MVFPVLGFDVKAARGMPFFELCDSVWDAVVKACWASNVTKDVDAQFEYALANRLEEHWRISYAVHEMEYDVLSGGFSHYFWSHGDTLNESVLTGLGLIGAFEHQEIFREAVANQSDDEALSKLKLATRFYHASPDPRELLAKYIITNFDRFSSQRSKTPGA
jgi:hypothetical protein